MRKSRLSKVKQAKLMEHFVAETPALFAADPEQFLDFIHVTEDDVRWKFFVNSKNWGVH